MKLEGPVYGVPFDQDPDEPEWIVVFRAPGDTYQVYGKYVAPGRLLSRSVLDGLEEMSMRGWEVERILTRIPDRFPLVERPQ